MDRELRPPLAVFTGNYRGVGLNYFAVTGRRNNGRSGLVGVGRCRPLLLLYGGYRRDVTNRRRWKMQGINFSPLRLFMKFGIDLTRQWFHTYYSGWVRHGSENQGRLCEATRPHCHSHRSLCPHTNSVCWLACIVKLILFWSHVWYICIELTPFVCISVHSAMQSFTIRPIQNRL